METTDDIIQFLTLYLQSRNAHKFGYVGYKVFKNLVCYITGIKDVGAVRIIFEKMVKLGWFIKRRTGTKTDYKFVFDN